MSTPSLRVHLVPRRDLGGEKSPPKRASAGDKAIKARGGEPLRACFDFNSSSLSRARKILQATPCKFFRRCSLTKRVRVKRQSIKVRCPQERMLSRTPPWGGWAGHTCDEKLDRASLNPTKTFSETELRAAQPSVHRRCNRLLNAAARPATSQAGRKIK